MLRANLTHNISSQRLSTESFFEAGLSSNQASGPRYRHLNVTRLIPHPYLNTTSHLRPLKRIPPPIARSRSYLHKASPSTLPAPRDLSNPRRYRKRTLGRGLCLRSFLIGKAGVWPLISWGVGLGGAEQGGRVGRGKV
jgi:hypothetical protein